MVSISHSTVSGRKITRDDFNNRTTTITGTSNKYLGFDGSGDLAEKNAPTGGGSSIFINVVDYGATGDGVTDDLPAFEAALAYAETLASAQNPALHKATPKIYVPTPAQHYYLSDSLNINICVELFGDGSGAPNTSGTLLRFGNNCSGIIINEYRTYGDGVGSVGDGSGSLVKGFTLYGGNVTYNGTSFTYGSGTSSTGHGVWIRGTGVRVEDMQVFFFAENGVYIAADSNQGNDATQGNANNFRIQDIWSVYNDGAGVLVYGLDANAGVGVNVNAIQCRIAGIMDMSFLGNTWIQPHVRDCGIISSTGLLLPTGMCSYPTASSCYTVAYGRHVQASTTEPGTDSTVWIPTSATHPNAKPWVSGMTWAVGAPYIVTNINARTTFINPYAESAQGLCQANGNALFMHGLMDLGDECIAGIYNEEEGVHVKVGSQALTAPALTARSTNSYIGGDAHFGISGGTFSHKLTTYNADGRVSWNANNGGSGASIWAAAPPDDDLASCFMTARLRISPFASPEARGGGYGVNFITATSDVVGNYLYAGDIFYNTSTTAGSNTHWYCDTFGVAASGAVLKPSGIRGGVQAAAVADASGGSTVDTECRAQLNALLASLRTAKLIAT